ncbi:Fc.00g093280.m01.CDS01 [Cosmosporella sp. VM-42]
MLSHQLLFLASVVGVFGLTPGRIGGVGQKPLGDEPASNFNCDLPPVLDPDGDGLPSADSLFSSHDALLNQVKRHQAVIRVPSICYDDLGNFDEDERWRPFYDLHKVLEDTYPAIHKRATLDKVNTFGLVYTIQGDSDLDPILLAAHQDVVPVENVDEWEYPPFNATWDGQYLYGRGASDDKNSLTALMSAVEALISDPDWAPKRTLILAFGFDEECSGYRGAASISKHLEERYGEHGIAVILDEGGMGVEQLGDTLYALPAVYEKGALDVWFDLDVAGGHSSIPFPHTGIGIMSEIVTALESHPYDPQLIRGSPVYNYLVCQARYSPRYVPRIAQMLRRNDIDGLTRELARTSPTSRYLIQTSQAVDIIEGGRKINALPESVTLGVNYRIAPQNSIKQVQHNVVRVINSVVQKYNLRLDAYQGDEEYEKYVADFAPEDLVTPSNELHYGGNLVVRVGSSSDVTPISPTDGAVWDVFSGSVQHSFAFKQGRVVPTGQTMTGNTDTRHYLNLSPNIYRWTPTRERGQERIHTANERIRMKSHMEIVRFYYDLIRNFDAAKL